MSPPEQRLEHTRQPVKGSRRSASLNLNQPLPTTRLPPTENLFSAAIATFIQLQEAMVPTLLQDKELFKKIASHDPSAAKLVQQLDSQIADGFSRIKEKTLQSTGSHHAQQHSELSNNIDEARGRARVSFYMLLGSQHFLQLSHQRDLFQEQLKHCSEQISKLPKDSSLLGPARRLQAAIQAIIPRADAHLISLKSIANTQIKPPYDNVGVQLAGKFQQYINDNTYRAALLELSKATESMSQTILSARKSAEKEELLDSVMESLGYIAVAVSIASSGGLAAPAASVLRAILIGSSVFSMNRLRKELDQLELGRQTFEDLARNVAIGYPSDLTKSTVAAGAFYAAEIAAGAEASRFVPRGAKAGMAFNLTTTGAGLLEQSLIGNLTSLSDIASQGSMAIINGAIFGTLGSRFAQLYPQARSRGEFMRLAITELGLISVLTAQLEEAQKQVAQPTSSDYLRAAIVNLPSSVIGHLVTGPFKSYRPPPTADEIIYLQFRERALELGLSADKVLELYKTTATDPVTGFNTDADSLTGFRTAEHRNHVMRSIAKWSQTGGDIPSAAANSYPITEQQRTKSRKHRLISEVALTWETVQNLGLRARTSYYIEADIRNQSGLNKILKDQLLLLGFGEDAAAATSKQLANGVMRQIASIFRDEVSKVSDHAEMFRHGGDEFSAIAVNADPRVLKASLARASARINSYLRQLDLDGITSTKTGNPPGMGIYFGVANLESCDYDLQRVFNVADMEIEAAKQNTLPSKSGHTPNPQTPNLVEKLNLSFNGITLLDVDHALHMDLEIPHSGNSSLKPFATPDEVYAVYNLKRLQSIIENGTTDMAFKLFGGAPRDKVTNLYSPTQRVPAVVRAISDRARSNVPTFWISARVENLSGLNKARGHSGANIILAEATSAANNAISSQGRTVYGFRNSGGNINFLTVGLSNEQVSQAMIQAQQAVNEVATKHGLTRLINPETGNKSGLSLVIGKVEIKPDAQLRRLFSEADRTLAAAVRPLKQD